MFTNILMNYNIFNTYLLGKLWWIKSLYVSFGTVGFSFLEYTLSTLLANVTPHMPSISLYVYQISVVKKLVVVCGV